MDYQPNFTCFEFRLRVILIAVSDPQGATLARGYDDGQVSS